MKMFAVAIILGFASLIGKICLILVGNGGGITKTRLFKYIENFTIKKRKFSDKKKSDIFFYISVQSIDCW